MSHFKLLSSRLRLLVCSPSYSSEQGGIGDEFGTIGWQFSGLDGSTSRDHVVGDTASRERGLKEKVYRDPSNEILQSVAELDAAGDYETPKGLKRLVCCGAKKYAEQGTRESGENRKKEEMSHICSLEVE
jgi:hypothetical protein